MCFGIDEVNIKIEVIIQMQCQYVPFVSNVHHIVHWANLVKQSIFNLCLVLGIEIFL
jgi:hypothetical protein